MDGAVSHSGDGLSWATAFKTINEAVSFAFSNDEIWVKEGTYLLKETITIKNGEIALYGGFSGWETALDQRDWEKNVT